MKLTSMNAAIFMIAVSTYTVVIVEAMPNFMVTIQMAKDKTSVTVGVFLSKRLIVTTSQVYIFDAKDLVAEAGCTKVNDTSCAVTIPIRKIIIHPEAEPINVLRIDYNIALVICKKEFKSPYFPIPYQSISSIKFKKCKLVYTFTAEPGTLTIKKCEKQNFLKNPAHGVCAKEPHTVQEPAVIICYKTGDPLQKNKGLLVALSFRYFLPATQTYAVSLFPYRPWIEKNSVVQLKQTISLLILILLLSTIFC